MSDKVSDYLFIIIYTLIILTCLWYPSYKYEGNIPFLARYCYTFIALALGWGGFLYSLRPKD